MSFIERLKETLDEDFNTSVTENGAIGYRTSGNELLDLNFAVSSLRSCSDSDVVKRFAKAYFENKLLAVKWLFFASDVRGGMGERRLFRLCINWLAKENPDVVKAVLPLIPEYNRWDNLWNLLDTDIHDTVIKLIKDQLYDDAKNYEKGQSISLLAKWLPSANASSQETKELAKRIIKGLHTTERGYRKVLSTLRKYLDVVEVKMSANEWKKIKYEAVPSKANVIYKDAFMRHDSARREAYLDSLANGEAKINAGVLFPHDVVHKYVAGAVHWKQYLSDYDRTIEELWKALPDYVQGTGNTICVADGSGSMSTCVDPHSGVTCLDVANALAIYFAEHSSGEFKDKYITFSENPQLVDFSKANTLRDKLEIALSNCEVANTNIEAVFDLILYTAIKNHMSQEDMPKNILILSDMEFDYCTQSNAGEVTTRLFKNIEMRFENAGYQIPRVVFWNIASRTETIPLKENNLGVALVSGFSPTVMKMVLSNQLDPFACLLEQINSERYDDVERAIIPLFS